MKMFIGEDDWSGKVNFIDDNNVLVGYDMSQDCCEWASWFILDHVAIEMPDESSMEIPGDLEGYNFVPDFFKKIQSFGDEEWSSFDQGSMVVFKMVTGSYLEPSKEKYLHIFNSHNGYYSHGFSISVGGETIEDGYL